MITIKSLLALTATLVLVSGKPQDLFFPEDSEDRTPPSQTPAIPVTQSTVTTIPPGTTTTIRSTRIPARDPGNRIVYIVSCDCKFTYEYNPVCGTDGQTYGNMGVLRCAKQCGKELDVFLVGACGSNNG